MWDIGAVVIIIGVGGRLGLLMTELSQALLMSKKYESSKIN